MDDILMLFLETQQAEALALAKSSALLELHVLDQDRFVAEFRCRGLVREETGEIHEHDHFAVGIHLPEDYLRDADPARILTWLDPAEIWHPNVRPPYACVGSVAPGTPLVDLLHRCFELITYANFGTVENDSLNRSACSWARQHRELFPIDPRPIRWQPAGAAS